MPAMQSPQRSSPVSPLARLWQSLIHCETNSPRRFSTVDLVENNILETKPKYTTLSARQTRQEVLREHTRTLYLAVDVDLGLIARTSYGLREPDLVRLCQLAAQYASARQDELVRMADFSDALDQILLERGETK